MSTKRGPPRQERPQEVPPPTGATVHTNVAEIDRDDAPVDLADELYTLLAAEPESVEVNLVDAAGLHLTPHKMRWVEIQLLLEAERAELEAAEP